MVAGVVVQQDLKTGKERSAVFQLSLQVVPVLEHGIVLCDTDISVQQMVVCGNSLFIEVQ